MRLDPPPYPDLWGPVGRKVAQWGSEASAMNFVRHFMTKKLLGTPNLVGMGHLLRPKIWVWKDLDPMCFRRHGLSLQGEFIK